MNLFQQPRPRRFNHKYIYVDERKERLKKIEQLAREKLGLTPHKPLDREQIHQAFRAAMPHLSKGATMVQTNSFKLFFYYFSWHCFI